MEVSQDKFWSVLLKSIVSQKAILSFILCLGCYSKAVTSPAQAQTEAEKLISQKKRLPALQIVIEANKTRKDDAEVRKLLSRIAQIFFSDKAQNLYEESLSNKRSDLALAMDRISEALTLETDNLLLLEEKARLLLRKNECEKAAETLVLFGKMASSFESLQFLLYGTQICKGAFTVVTAPRFIQADKSKKLPSVVLLFDLEKFDRLKDEVKLRETLTSLETLDFRSPQVLYWKWKLGKTQKKQDVEMGKKYVQACKNLSSAEFREYFEDPHLCQYVSEVDETAN